MNPREFQRLAQRLVLNPLPAELRTAVSRAYYAAFHVSDETLQQWGFSISKGPAGHGEVRSHFGNSGDRDLARIGSQLNDLHSARIRADYRLERSDVEDHKTVQALVDLARRMIQEIEGCRSQQPRADAAIEVIRRWKQATRSP